MAFGINGSDFTLQPTTFKWSPRFLLGVTGDGHSIYTSVREAEIRWNIASQSEWYEWVNYYNMVDITGTVVVSLPQWGVSTYQFYNYSGCTLSEPQFTEYFTEHPKDVLLVVRNIQT